MTDHSHLLGFAPGLRPEEQLLLDEYGYRLKRITDRSAVGPRCLVIGHGSRAHAGGSESGSNKGPCPDEGEDGSDYSARGDTAGPRSVGVGHHLEPVGYPSDIGGQKPPAHESDATPHQLEHLTVHDARIVSLRRWQDISHPPDRT